jgi:hypothetical protein
MAVQFNTTRDSKELGCPPPPGDISSLQANEPPTRYSGGYLFEFDEKDVKLPTPTDRQTGVPLPWIIEEDIPPIGKTLDEKGRVIGDWNHAFHPRESLVKGTSLEIGLRSSRVQWMKRETHGNVYHRIFYGPDISEDQVKQFGTLIFAASGYIPGEALASNRVGSVVHIPITPTQRLRYWREGHIKVVNDIVIRNAILETAIRPGFEGIKTATVDEFLHTEDIARRFELGSNLLGIALYDAANPLRDLYKKALEEAKLPPQSPRTIGKKVLGLISGYKRVRAINWLRQNLEAAA